MWSLYAIVLGFMMDLLLGDPPQLTKIHPVVLIGRMIAALEKLLRKLFPKTESGEKTAGLVLWILTIVISAGIPILLLWICHTVSPWLRLVVETIMCWQLIAVKSLRTEALKVYEALRKEDVEEARKAVSMIVGRDTEKLDEDGITKAAIETVAENTSDGAVAPLFFMALGGAVGGFIYKAVNTMDSMLGYVEPPYKNIGMVPAKMDDVFNFIPARLSAILMFLGGVLLRLRVRNGWKIFRRDRYKHASPNSAQTESMCAGLLGIQLAGDAWYHGVLHKKEYIGDPLRPVVKRDIVTSCELLYLTSMFAFLICIVLRILILVLIRL